MMFPFDQAEFLRSLSHLGEPLVPELPVLRRNGLPNGYADAIGPLPYSLALAAHSPAELRSLLEREGMVSFLAVLKPGASLDASRWRAAGFEVLPSSPHFVWRPGRPPLDHSARTKRNLRLAQAHWQVRSCDPSAHAAEVAAIYAELFARRRMTALLNFPQTHFEALAKVPQLEMLGAFDEEGLGAFLLYVRWEQEVHTLHLAGAERAYRTAAAYALFEELWQREHGDHALYLGGVPRSPGAEGIGRFKQRFAPETETPLCVRALLDPQACLQLQQQRGTHAWVPPYRTQYGD